MSDGFPKQINENLFILGNAYFHLYLIRGKEVCALVETGISATAEIAKRQLSAMKLLPEFLIITHPHSDHITGLDSLRTSYPKAKVIAGAGAEAFINHPKSLQGMIAEDIHMTRSLVARGFSNDVEASMKSVPNLTGCIHLKDGEEMDVGGVKIRFLEAKGHSPANILVYLPETRTLLVSDSLGNLYPKRGFFPTFFTGYNDYLQTIDRLEKFNPEVLGLAHGGWFASTREIESIFQQAEASATDVKNYIMNDLREDEAVARDLFDFYYADELSIYSPQNIMNCCRLLVKRVREL